MRQQALTASGTPRGRGGGRRRAAAATQSHGAPDAACEVGAGMRPIYLILSLTTPSLTVAARHWHQMASQTKCILRPIRHIIIFTISDQVYEL